MRKPNILLIMFDTVRCDALSCMGGIKSITPNLDKLAQEGVMFEQSHTVSPVCGPSRCSLMTGVYPKIHMAVENGLNRIETLPVITDFLKEEDYTTIMVGKTHFGKLPKSFDVQDVSGEKSSDCNDSYAAFVRENGYERPSKFPFNKPEEYCIDAYLAKRAIEEIDKVKDNNSPFFAFCSFPSPHGPIDTLQEYIDKFKDIDIPDINIKASDLENLPPYLRKILGLGTDMSPPDYGEGSSKLDEAGGTEYTLEMHEEIQEFKRKYYALMNYCDAQVGKIIDYLNNSGLRENTLVIFTSDHGQQYFDHGFNDKHNFYDESFRVPLIMSMPNTLPQGTTDKFATTTDVSATILGAAGVSSDLISGYDLFTALKNNLENPRKYAVGMLYRYISLVTEKYKIEYYLDSYTGRLFDRKNDPKELNDVFNDYSYKADKMLLIQALLSWYSSLDDINYQKQNSVKGGPIASIVKSMIDVKTALSSEDKLSEFLSVNNLL